MLWQRAPLCTFTRDEQRLFRHVPDSKLKARFMKNRVELPALQAFKREVQKLTWDRGNAACLGILSRAIQQYHRLGATHEGGGGI